MSFPRPALPPALIAAALLAGCAAPPPEATPAPAADRALPAALYEAPDRAELRCRGERPMSAGQTFEELPLTCPPIEVAVSPRELHDAGWRVESVELGEPLPDPEGRHQIAVTLTLRKLF